MSEIDKDTKIRVGWFEKTQRQKDFSLGTLHTLATLDSGYDEELPTDDESLERFLQHVYDKIEGGRYSNVTEALLEEGGDDTWVDSEIHSAQDVERAPA